MDEKELDGLLRQIRGEQVREPINYDGMIEAAFAAAEERRAREEHTRSGLPATWPVETDRLSDMLDTSPEEELLQIIKQAAKGRRTALNLVGKRLTTLPQEIGQLSNLTSLDLSYNQLTALPPEIGQLSNLTKLNFKNNKLTALPPEIGQLPHLTELYLGSNKLITLPPEIIQLPNLTHLHLGINKLTVLPPVIGQLFNLTSLDLSYNQLTALPPEIGQLTNLQKLDVSGNPLISPPPAIVEQGKQAILAYLREQLEASRRQWVSKLLVVGEGGVGKTALLRALCGEPFDPQLETTHGIRIESLALTHPTQTVSTIKQPRQGLSAKVKEVFGRKDVPVIIDAPVTMQLNAWDFGGQEIYHATHQFFLTNRSLFVLAWSARHGYEQGKLYYWLDTIQARAPESPVILVATHIDERDADLPLSDLRAKYPQIVAHCEISNKTAQGIEELRKALIDAAVGLPLMGEIWPATWLDAAEAIRAREEKHITPQALWEIMAVHEVSDDNAQILARWLHELGDILYFQDDEELDDLVILKPQWVTKYISDVLESEEVIGGLGIFTRAHMRELWGDLEPEMQDHFLRLMEQFDLSYRTLENREISLVVERLSLEPSDYAPLWDTIRKRKPCREISMRFKLNTIPAGIPTWFIARSHRFTTRTHWRTGALFVDSRRNPRHLALARTLPHERYIQLTVRGPNPHNFFTLLKDGIEVTLDRFPGLEIERLIPCPGHNGKPCSHEFSYAHLQKAIEQIPPVPEIQCPVSFERVSVPGLLFGLHWRLQDAVLERIDSLETTVVTTVVEGQEEILAELGALRELAQRGFTTIYRREQSVIESHCPNVFALRVQDKAITGSRKLELQLYCQAPGYWHPTAGGGRYTVDDPAKWIKTVAPYLRKLVAVLKYAAPLAGPWVAWAWPAYEKMFENDIKLTTELVKKLPDFEDREAGLLETAGGPRGPGRATGAALRALRQLLDDKDSDHHWGGLKKVLTPEGHYLWLCEYHAQEYAK
ncbi:MAG: COR domain-containing protein [Chloroflexota bacterium]|nr:COR domain-containing protein [Chloroflexota bacterium]